MYYFVELLGTCTSLRNYCEIEDPPKNAVGESIGNMYHLGGAPKQIKNRKAANQQWWTFFCIDQLILLIQTHM
jgi:hypothetical protein